MKGQFKELMGKSVRVSHLDNPGVMDNLTTFGDGWLNLLPSRDLSGLNMKMVHTSKLFASQHTSYSPLEQQRKSSEISSKLLNWPCTVHKACVQRTNMDFYCPCLLKSCSTGMLKWSSAVEMWQETLNMEWYIPSQSVLKVLFFHWHLECILKWVILSINWMNIVCAIRNSIKVSCELNESILCQIINLKILTGLWTVCHNWTA